MVSHDMPIRYLLCFDTIYSHFNYFKNQYNSRSNRRWQPFLYLLFAVTIDFIYQNLGKIIGMIKSVESFTNCIRISTCVGTTTPKILR